MADRLAVMSEGRIVQIGRPEEVYRRPQSRLVAEFIGETNILRGDLVSSKEGVLEVSTRAGTFFAHAAGKAGAKAGGDVLISIRPEGWKISNVGGPGAIPAILRSTIYLGELAQHDFESGGEMLKALELNPHLSTRTPGEQYFLEPLDVVALDDQP